MENSCDFFVKILDKYSPVPLTKKLKEKLKNERILILIKPEELIKALQALPIKVNKKIDNSTKNNK